MALRHRPAGGLRESRPLRPEALGVTPSGQLLAELQQRRVRGQDEQAPSGGQSPAAPGRGLAAIRATTLRRSGATPAYLSRSAISAARVPAHVTCSTRSASSSKSASQIHETSLPSAVRSLRIASSSIRPGFQRQRAEDLVGPGRVLDEQDRAPRCSPICTSSARPNAAATCSSPGATAASGIPSSRHRLPPRARCRRCRAQAAEA